MNGQTKTGNGIYCSPP